MILCSLYCLHIFKYPKLINQQHVSIYSTSQWAGSKIENISIIEHIYLNLNTTEQENEKKYFSESKNL